MQVPCENPGHIFLKNESSFMSMIEPCFAGIILKCVFRRHTLQKPIISLYRITMETFIMWLVELIGKLGYPGPVILMAMESTFFPIPSELVLPPAGYLVSQGQMNGVLVVAAGTLGSLIGALFNYALALYLGRPLILRFGKYILLTNEKFTKVDQFFNVHGEISTFTGRFIPVVRHFISFPAGLARMNLARFCLYTVLGSCMWSTILTSIGYLVGNNLELVKLYMHQVTLAVILCLAMLVAVYIKWQKKESSATDAVSD
jgi:membrane protein DedA with SNARE-associated domain